MGIVDDLRKDYEISLRAAVGSATFVRMMRAFLSDPGFRAVSLYRIGNSFARRGYRRLGRLAERMIRVWCDCSISVNAEIAPGLAIRHVGGLRVGRDARIGPGCELRHEVTLGGNQGKRTDDGRIYPTLEANVSIGPGAKLLGPITIGERSFIGANSVVISDIPPDSVAAGSPARVIRREGKPVPLLERGGEATEVLKEVIERVSRIEARLDSILGDSENLSGRTGEEG